MIFSKRMRYEPDIKPLQFESMDEGLRMSIHNAFREYEAYNGNNTRIVYQYIWTMVMERDLDEYKSWGLEYNLGLIKSYFFELKWNKVYDYVEWYLHFQLQPINLIKELNTFFEYHNSAYRIVEGKIIPISNEVELSEVSEACHTGQKAIDFHMKKAIEIFSDKNTKDFPNTVKEAITAVEAAVNIINGTEGKTLGDALKELNKKKTIHPALSEAFQKIYGYSSDKHTGSRHAIVDDATCIPDFADAKFMLVACSAFINYLMQRNT